MEEKDFAAKIVSIPDYPEPGVIFKDGTPLFGDAQAFHAAVDAIADHFKDAGITKVIGSEARGLMIGAPVAYALGVGFVPARKPGKLPRAVYSQEYSLEYGTDELQIHKDAMGAGDRALVIDDLVATGGTTVATAKLVEKTGAEVAGFAFIIELSFLNPRAAIEAEYPGTEVFSLVHVR